MFKMQSFNFEQRPRILSLVFDFGDNFFFLEFSLNPGNFYDFRSLISWMTRTPAFGKKHILRSNDDCSAVLVTDSFFVSLFSQR